MALKEFKDYPDTTTPINSENLNFNFEEVLNMAFDAMYPINKIVVFYDTKDHSDYLGFTWELVSKGNFPVGYNPEDNDYNQIGKTGGEKKHILTVEEMPKHRHNMNYGDALGGNGTGYAYSGTIGTGPAAMLYAGGDQPHENRPPYEVMAFWRRIA